MTVSLTHSTPADGTFSATGATAWDAQHVLTQDTARLLGRTTAGVGATEEISVGTGLSLSGGTLTNTVTATAPGGSNTQLQFNNSGAFAGASGLTTDGTSLTIAGATNPTAPTLSLTAGSNITGTTLSGVQITGTAGQFSCNAASLSVGQLLTISGTLGGTGTITGYINPTTYRISATNGSTTFTLVNNIPGGAITTTTGTPTGLTYTVTSPGVDIAQTWNNTNVTFTGLRYNVTDTVSASGSLLMNLQVGGVSKFRVDKFGGITTNGDTSGVQGTFLCHQDSASRSLIIGGPTQSSASLAVNITGVSVSSTKPFGFGVWGVASTAALDTILTRRAAASLRLGAADTSASATVTVTIASPGVVTWTSHGLSTGTPVIFTTTGALPTGITADTTYYAIVVNANTFQIATSFAAALAGTAVNTSGSQSGTHTGRRGAIAQTFGPQDTLSVSSSTNIDGADFVIRGSRSIGDKPGGSIIFQVAPAGSSGTAQNALTTALQVNGNGGVTGQDGATANTLALRNGTNAQTLNVYNTYTSATNFERFRIVAQSAAAVLIGTEKGSGGGTARALELQTDATSRLTLDTVGSAQIVTALTVATLPATPLTGMIARVTDALAPAVGVTVAAGGAAQALCWYNGANWTVIGV